MLPRTAGDDHSQGDALRMTTGIGKGNPRPVEHLSLIDGTRCLGELEIAKGRGHRVTKFVLVGEGGGVMAGRPALYHAQELLLRGLEPDAAFHKEENRAAFARLAVLLMRGCDPGRLSFAISGAEKKDHRLGPADPGEAGLLRGRRGGREVLAPLHLMAERLRRACGSVPIRLEAANDRAHEDLHRVESARRFGVISARLRSRDRRNPSRPESPGYRLCLVLSTRANVFALPPYGGTRSPFERVISCFVAAG